MGDPNLDLYFNEVCKNYSNFVLYNKNTKYGKGNLMYTSYRFNINIHYYNYYCFKKYYNISSEDILENIFKNNYFKKYITNDLCNECEEIVYEYYIYFKVYVIFMMFIIFII